jgi:hypothetical protein
MYGRRGFSNSSLSLSEYWKNQYTFGSCFIFRSRCPLGSIEFGKRSPTLQGLGFSSPLEIELESKGGTDVLDG